MIYKTWYYKPIIPASSSPEERIDDLPDHIQEEEMDKHYPKPKYDI